jgi:hypothetical protein
MRRQQPKATRPNIPGYGVSKKKTGMLPWKWAQDRLRKSKQYWLATTRPDARPHVMVIWGVWVNDEFWFSTGNKSRKARNLAANPQCVICNEDSAHAVIVEGTVEVMDEKASLEPVFVAYQNKYKMDIRGMGEPVFRVKPAVVFGLYEKRFGDTATRWLFPESTRVKRKTR